MLACLKRHRFLAQTARLPSTNATANCYPEANVECTVVKKLPLQNWCDRYKIVQLQMNTCTTLLRTSLSSFKCSLCSNPPTLSALPPAFFLTSGLRVASRCYASTQEATSIEPIHANDQPLSENPIIEPPEAQSNDTVEHLLTHADGVARLMKMERKTLHDGASRWFPYLDRFKCQNTYVTGSEILEAVGPCISDVRKDRFRNVVRNRSYSVCLVVEGLSDFGNVSAAFRSADALGFQSVHVVSCDSSKRCTDN